MYVDYAVLQNNLQKEFIPLNSTRTTSIAVYQKTRDMQNTILVMCLSTIILFGMTEVTDAKIFRRIPPLGNRSNNGINFRVRRLPPWIPPLGKVFNRNFNVYDKDADVMRRPPGGRR
ncbi:uncharacterized protein LOC135156232 [Lytechinus pictus]|uniref:uncharacterized protein LOC135156232 n=1 Tax=Lytechinus pictus TaxID=7653 RepID=UPI0030B9DC37